jgi:hypothetical protein
MSRHRVTGQLLAEPGTEVNQVQGRNADEALADLLGHTELERLYSMVLAFPRAADRLLSERRVPDPVVRYTLRAETALRLDRPREAMTLASGAVDHAVQEAPVDPGRLLPAATILADAAVVAGAPDAVRSCIDLADLAGQFGDEHRAAVAAGLHAVAVYQQESCRQAAHLLDRLGRGCTDSGIAAAIALACDTVTVCCASRGQPHWPPATLPVITSGGLVQSALTPLFLPDRFQRWPGIHDCPLTSSSTRSLV